MAWRSAWRCFICWPEVQARPIKLRTASLETARPEPALLRSNAAGDLSERICEESEKIRSSSAECLKTSSCLVTNLETQMQYDPRNHTNKTRTEQESRLFRVCSCDFVDRLSTLLKRLLNRIKE